MPILTPNDICDIQLEASRSAPDGMVSISREILEELLYNYKPETARLRAEVQELRHENANLRRTSPSNTRIYD